MESLRAVRQRSYAICLMAVLGERLRRLGTAHLRKMYIGKNKQIIA